MTIDSFETVTAAAQRIVEIERYPVSGVFFEILIDTQDENEDGAFGHLEHTAKSTNRQYVVQRIRH